MFCRYLRHNDDDRDMLSVGDLGSKALLTISTSTLSLLVPPNPISPSSFLSLSSSQTLRRTRLAKRSDGSRVWASKEPPKLELSQMLEIRGLRSFDGELGEDFDGGDDFEDDDDDDDDFIMPIERMTQWLENKPQGFGEGKVYDTVVEDQLLDEMRQSREAQAANLNKLKNEPLGLIQSKSLEQKKKKKKADEIVPSGIRVRVTNLPKKKNVHRDLSSAFKGVAGLTSINPAVTGNIKTRDPICKGFGFVYFKSEKDANRFVETFSRQSIAFGKVQKQIKCEIVDSVPEKSTDEASGPVSEAVKVQALEEDQSSDSSLEEWENGVLAEFEDFDDENADGSEWEDFDEDEEEEEELEEDIGSVTELELNDSGSYEQRTETVQQSVKRLTVKDKDAKVPKIKTPKLDIPGSARRLKVKEKAVLSDVFNKYGKKSAVGSKKGRKKS